MASKDRDQLNKLLDELDALKVTFTTATDAARAANATLDVATQSIAAKRIEIQAMATKLGVLPEK